MQSVYPRQWSFHLMENAASKTVDTSYNPEKVMVGQKAKYLKLFPYTDCVYVA